MSCLSRVSAYTAALFGTASHFTSRTVSHQCSFPLSKPTFHRARLTSLNLKFLLPISRAHCYSSKKPTARTPRKKKSDPDQQLMEQEQDSFFVVRKGDLVGVYKNFVDCQAQAGTSICDPPVSVYKGSSLPKGAVEHLLSRGLQNALYTIRAADLKEDLFGTLVPCPIQQPPSSGVEKDASGATNKRSHELLESCTTGTDVSVSDLTDPLRKHAKLDIQSETQALSYDPHSCTLEFDGASKGNPGPAGAGALLRAADGSVICRLREGLGITTNNVAEYRAMILGLKCALEKGYTKIRVQGDSKLVCSQVQGLWKARQENISKLHAQAKDLKDRFLSFHISHIRREFNSEADAEANLAVHLADGQVQADFE
ncbi:RNase H family protein [Euphorbia peplus]|nr:RNase H family protein [Euphorbia peplus]